MFFIDFPHLSRTALEGGFSSLPPPPPLLSQAPLELTAFTAALCNMRCRSRRSVAVDAVAINNKKFASLFASCWAHVCVCVRKCIDFPLKWALDVDAAACVAARQ